MRAHVVENGVVVNTIDVDSLDFLPNLIAGDVGGIGWTYENGQLSPPVIVPTVPESVTMKSARKALILAGISMPTIEAAFDTITDATQKELAKVDWEFSANVLRQSPLVASMATALGLTSQQVDDLFIAASKIVD